MNVDTSKISHAYRDALKALSVLLSANEEERKEKPLGMIRTKQKCPKCDKPFDLFDRLGYIRVEHQGISK